MSVFLLKQAIKELQECPKERLRDLYSLIGKLKQGDTLGPPISRPLYSIARGLSELRLSGKSGEFRVFYYIKIDNEIYIIHASTKKKQAIDKKTINLLKTRIKSIQNEEKNESSY